MAAGEPSGDLIDQVAAQLTRVLSLRSCRWQYGVAGLGHPARLTSDGRVRAGDRIWAAETGGLPADTETELLVESGGLLQGRFLLTARPDSRPTREQLLVAIALAEQVGAALGSGHPAGR